MRRLAFVVAVLTAFALVLSACSRSSSAGEAVSEFASSDPVTIVQQSPLLSHSLSDSTSGASVPVSPSSTIPLPTTTVPVSVPVEAAPEVTAEAIAAALEEAGLEVDPSSGVVIAPPAEDEIVDAGSTEVEVIDVVSSECVTDQPVSVLNANLGSSNGSYGGGDYQRAFDLGDGRVLWVLQDVFLSSHLVHNAAFVQSGSCFELLNDGVDNWLYENETRDQRRWFWIFDANVIVERNQVELVVAEMVETGSHYLNRVRVAGTSVVTVDTLSFEVLSSVPFQSNPDVSSAVDAPDFYGWSIVDNAGDGYRYLWSHCYAQFGFDAFLGFGECANDMFLARVAGPSITGPLEFWSGDGWSPDASAAVSTVNFFVTGAGINPGDVAFDAASGLWHLVVKVDDWWSDRVVFATAEHPAGPWTVADEVTVDPKCGNCNSYFASWVPAGGSPIAAWSVGHNHWSIGHTSHYFPTFHSFTSTP